MNNIFIVRHGQSIGNVDLKKYQEIADHAFELTDLGREQARQAAENILSNSSVSNTRYVFWVSPFKRARDTAIEMMNVILDQSIPPYYGKTYIEDIIDTPLIIEKQYGLYNQIAGHGPDSFDKCFPKYNKEYILCDKHEGRFFARPPGGESDFDVSVRAEAFWQKFHRYTDSLGDSNERQYNHVIVCHGTTMRILAMTYMNKPYEWFQEYKLPPNGTVIVPGKGTLKPGLSLYNMYEPFHE